MKSKHKKIIGDRSAFYFEESSSNRIRDDFGNLIVKDCNISKVCVSNYLGSEIQGNVDVNLDPNKVYRILRSKEALADAVSTFKVVPITMSHPDEGLDLPKNPADRIGSTGGDCVFQDPYLKTTLVFNVESAIEDIENEKQKELSLGYVCDIDMIPGEYQGQPYDGVMRNIVVNHVALVPRGRAGSDVAVKDELPEQKMNTDEMMSKIGQMLKSDLPSVSDEDADKVAKKLLQMLVAHEESEIKEETSVGDEEDKEESKSGAGKEKQSDNDEKNDDDDKEESKTVNKSDESVGDAETITMTKEELKTILLDARRIEREHVNKLSEAKELVKPLVGNVAVGDSAEEVYRAALSMKGIKSAETMHKDALHPMIELLVSQIAEKSAVGDAKTVDTQEPKTFIFEGL